MATSIHRLWLRRWFRICVWFVVAIFASLICIRQYIDWSGARRWEAVRKMLTREGESIDFRKTAPDPVPDDQNFCAIPPLKDLALIPDNHDDKSPQGLKLKRLLDTALPMSREPPAEAARVLSAIHSGHGSLQDLARINVPKPKLLHGASYGTPTDMAAWADWLRKDGSPPVSPYPAKDVLAALSRNDALVSELALGLSRPESQWTPSWKTRDLLDDLFPIPTPFSEYKAVQALSSMLCLRSAVAARAGEAAEAHDSLLVAVRIDQAFKTEPSIVGTLVAGGISAIVCGAVWELCDAHSGTAEDFNTLQHALSQLDFQKSFLFAERGELTFTAHEETAVKGTGNVPSLMPSPMNRPDSNGTTESKLHIVPYDWFDGTAATLVQWHFDYFVKPLRDANFRVLLAKQKELDAIVAEHRDRHPYMHLDEALTRMALS